MEEGSSSSRSKKRPAEDEADSTARSNKRPAVEEVPFDPRRGYLTLQEIIRHSPSGKDGIGWTMEAHYRRRACFFIRQVGMACKLSAKVIATASYYFHKFFMLQSFANIDPRTIGTACLSIATKDEDKPGSLWSVIVFSYSLNYPHNPEEAMKQIYESQEIFNSRKELIILAEKLVLATLNFTFEIPHPHDFLTAYVTTLAIEPVESKNKLIRVASEFANDGNLTTLSLQFCPQQIAGVCIFLAVKLLKLELQDGSESFWRNMIGVTQQQLEAICNQLLRIYVIFRKRRGLEENAGDGGGARADAEAPATNEAQAREPNPSSKGKEVVGSASGAGDGDGTSAAGDGDLASAAGDGDLASVAAETLVLLLHHARAVQQARAVQRVQADEPNPSSSKREEQVEGSSSPAATNALVLLGVTPKHSSSSEE